MCCEQIVSVGGSATTTTTTAGTDEGRQSEQWGSVQSLMNLLSTTLLPKMDSLGEESSTCFQMGSCVLCVVSFVYSFLVMFVAEPPRPRRRGSNRTVLTLTTGAAGTGGKEATPGEGPLPLMLLLRAR